MTDSAVAARGLRVVRGSTEVLRGLTFDVVTGSVTGLLGPSGCGKTTLIRSIAGSQRVTSGALEVLGTAPGAIPLRRSVAYAAQTAAVYADLTVEENIAYFAAVLGAPRGDVARVIAAVDLDRHRSQVVAQLSGGERSRVSLAVALLGEPKLLLLDEPTVGLDPVLRDELWTLFGRLAGDGLTLLVSSHVMDEAARCDALLLMRDGRLLTTTTPGELLERTCAPDMERAFLALIREAERGAA
jgi:ABC-2 type transport system ATP-binding protein